MGKRKRAKQILPERQLAEAKELYKFTDLSLSEIKHQFGWRMPNNRLVSLLSPEKTSLQCPICQTTLFRRVTRSSTSPPYCPKCNHQLISFCPCPECNKEREEKLMHHRQSEIQRLHEKEQVMKNTIIQPVKPVRFEDFATKHKILSCICLSWKGIRLDETGHPFISNVFSQKETIFPTEQTTYSIFQELLSLYILRIDDNISNNGLQAFDEKSCSINDLEAYTFRFNFTHEDEYAINDILTTRYWLSYEDFLSWWRWIALEEVRSYYHYLTGENKPVGKRTEAAWVNTIEEGSIMLCKHVLKYTIDTQRKWPDKRPGQHANTFLRTFQGIADKYFSGEWEYKKPVQTYYYTSSAVRYIFEKVLLTGTEAVFRPIKEAHELYEKYKERVTYDS